MAKETSFYSEVTVHFRDGVIETFKNVKTDTISIDNFDYLKFDRLLSLDKWATVTIDLDDNVRYYEVVPGEM